jgi:hypothetical protein
VSSREREWRVPRADVATYRPKADGSVRALDVGKGSSQRRARGITPVPLAQTRAVSRGTRPIARLPRRPGGSASPHVPRCSRRRPLARAGGGPRAQRPAAVATFGPVPVVRQWRRKDAPSGASTGARAGSFMLPARSRHYGVTKCQGLMCDGSMTAPIRRPGFPAWGSLVSLDAGRALFCARTASCLALRTSGGWLPSREYVERPLL